MIDPVYLISSNRSARDEAGQEIDLPKVRAVVVLFLSYGRNAWHATWIKRYREGDFTRDGRGARAKVARRKERGTVFYLDVLPAFQFEFGIRKFIVSEINTRAPFRYMDLEIARFGSMGFDLDHFLKTISPSSELWKSGQSQSNSIIIQEVENEFIDFTSYRALARGRDKELNPPLGSYQRVIYGSFDGESNWHWEPRHREGEPQTVSLRWYNRALEALVESQERLAEFRG